MFNSIKTRLKSLKKQGKYGAGYVDTVVKVITCVVVGALLLTGIYAIANTGMTTASNKTDSLFSYEAELPGGPGGAGGGGALPDGEDSGPIEMLDKTDNYEKAHVASQNLTFRSSAPIDTFESVEVNGVTVDPSHYTLTEGSTIVTFDKEYALSLPLGTNEIDIVSKNGTANADFTVTYTPGIYDDNGNLVKTWDELKAEYPDSFRNEGVLGSDYGDSSLEKYTDGGRLVISTEITEIYESGLGDCSFSEIIFPETITSFGDYAFTRCSSLKTINILGGVNEIGLRALTYVTSLEEINVSADNNYYSSEDGVLFNKDKTSLIRYPWAKVDASTYTVPDSVTTIETCAFNYNQGLTEVRIPKSVVKMGVDAFTSMPLLTNVYYAGSEAEWKAIPVVGDMGEIGDISDAFQYYSDSLVFHYDAQF